MSAIRFGTDGWRAIIAEDFTFANVRAVSQAVADYMTREDLASRGIVVGHDTRFLSGSFAAAAAEVFAANEIAVALSSGPVPTPAVSFGVLDREAGAGLVITASHNPARWNGIKIKLEYGGSAPEDVTNEIEQAIPGIITGDRVRTMPLGEAEARDLVDRVDLRPTYFTKLRSFVDIDAIREAGFNILMDPMYGAAAGWLAELIGEGSTQVHELHNARNPSFPGIRSPEPIAANLGTFLARLESGGYDVGLATDGDGDRVALATEGGTFVTSLQTFALLVHYLLTVRGERGPLVRSITTTRMIDRLGERYDCPVHETPVGFRHVGGKMMEVQALIAGEESGGFSIHGHIPERDGLLAALLILDSMVQTAKRPSELLSELYEELGPHEYGRVDVTLREDERDGLMERVSSEDPEMIAGLKVISRDTVDGVRFTLEGGWWLLLRLSGTEPLLRIYAEMPSMEQVQDALQAGQEMAGATL